MEAKQLRHEHSVAKFASIALLHFALDKTKQKDRSSQRRLPLEDGDVNDELPFDAQTISLQQLMALRTHFDRHNGALDEAAFVDAFKAVGSKMSELHLRWWFRRIDSDESGEVDWGELSTFIIAGTVDESGRIVAHDEHPEDAMFSKEEKGVSVPPTVASPNAIAGINHSDFITTIYNHPRIGKYFTASQDGTVRVWDASTLEFEFILHHGKWVTSICASPDDTQLFVAGLDRSITVFELGNLSKAPRCYIGNILDENHKVPKGRPIHRAEILSRNVPDAPGSGFHPGESLEDFRLRSERIRYRQIPDQMVQAHILRQLEFPANCIACVPGSDVLFLGLSSGRLQGYPLVHRSLLKGHFVDAVLNVDPHDNFPVTTLMWAEFFDGFLSTAADGSVALTNIQTSVVVKVGIAANPIYGSVWMEAPRLLATCGASRDISLWSASPQTSTTKLTGHFSSVVGVVYDANDNWLISMDTERMIVVWNMHNMQPIQSITDYDSYQLGRFSCLYYDHMRNRIVCASTAPVVFAKGTTNVPLADPSYKGHQRPLVGCLYNRVFNQIVTADIDCIKVWEAVNGRLRASMSVAALRATGMPMKYAGGGHVTSIRFDTSHRRLIVGMSSATICVMNMSNCHLILECHRSTVKLLPAVDAGSCCFVPQGSSRMGKKGFLLLVGGRMLHWEDKDSMSTVGYDRETTFTMTSSQFELMAKKQQTPVQPISASMWRSPQPVAISSHEGQIAVGTDCGVVLLYSSVSAELTGFTGVYDPKISITALGWHEVSNSLVYSANNGDVVFCPAFHRNKQIVVRQQDECDGPVAALTFDITTRGPADDHYLAVGDEDGCVHTWRVRSINYDDVKPFTTLVVSRECGRRLVEYIASFRAHMTEVSSISLMPANDDAGTVRVVTASSDCQCRLFTMEGLFVGYVGAGWNIGVSFPRSVLRNIPAPMQDAPASSRSFSLKHFLPDMQLDDPRLDVGAAASVVSPSSTTAALRIGHLLVSPEQTVGKLNGEGTSATPAQTSGMVSLQLPALSPRHAAAPLALSPRHRENTMGVFSSGKSAREAAAQMAFAPTQNSKALSEGGHHLESNLAVSPRHGIHARARSNKSDANPLLRNQHSHTAAQSGANSRGLAPMDPVALTQGCEAPVTVAGSKPVPSLSLDSLLQARKPNSQRRHKAPPLSFLGQDDLGHYVGQQSPLSSAKKGQSSSLDASVVASMVPLLHLNRTPTGLLPSTAIGEEASTSAPHSSRLDEWHQRHRVWVAEQSGTDDSVHSMIKTARPMTMLKMTPVVDVFLKRSATDTAPVVPHAPSPEAHKRYHKRPCDDDAPHYIHLLHRYTKNSTHPEAAKTSQLHHAPAEPETLSERLDRVFPV